MATEPPNEGDDTTTVDTGAASAVDTGELDDQPAPEMAATDAPSEPLEQIEADEPEEADRAVISSVMRNHPERVERYMQAIYAGATLADAAAYGGISDRQVRRWMEWGRDAVERGDPEDSFALFAKRVRDTESQSAIKDLIQMNILANAGDFKALRWRLGRFGYREGEELHVLAPEGPLVLVMDDALADA